jgi:hypothetical protein
VWNWYVFGKGVKDSLMFVQIAFEVPLWRRILTRVLLGSVWERYPAWLMTAAEAEEMGKRDWPGAEL